MEYEIIYQPHRNNCTAVATSPLTVRYQVEYLYGPPGVLFDVEPRTLVSPSMNSPRSEE